MFVDGDEIIGVVDWSEAGRGDALCDLATLTLGRAPGQLVEGIRRVVRN